MMIAADRIPVAATSITKSEVAANEALSGARTRLSLWPSEPILLLPRIPLLASRAQPQIGAMGAVLAPPTRRRGFWRLGRGRYDASRYPDRRGFHRGRRKRRHP